MDYYHEIDNVNTIKGLTALMKQEIEEYNPVYLSNWNDIYNSGIDGCLVNIGYLLIVNGCYEFDDWKNLMHNELYELFSDYRCSNQDFDKILNQVWDCRYDESKGKAQYDSVDKVRRIRDIASSKFPFFKRIVNRDSTLVVSIALCIIFSFNIISSIDYSEYSDYWRSAYVGYEYGLIGSLLRNLNSYTVIVLLADLFIVIALLGSKHGKVLFSFTPVTIFAMHCILVFPYILFPVYNYRVLIDFLKDIVLSGSVYLLLIPVLVINKRRVYEYWLNANKRY